MVDVNLAEILHTEVGWAGALGGLLHNHPLGAGARGTKDRWLETMLPPRHLELVLRAPGTCPPAQCPHLQGPLCPPLQP